MTAHLFYYQLALLALLWLFVMLPLPWLRRSVTTTTTPATPLKPKRTCSDAPQVFEGLTHKPPCALCERDPAPSQPAPPAPPEPMPRPSPPPWWTPSTSVRAGCTIGLAWHLRANGHPSVPPVMAVRSPAPFATDVIRIIGHAVRRRMMPIRRTTRTIGPVSSHS
jgi:hypothetical protein